MRSAELDDDVTAFLAERASRTAAEFGVDIAGRELPLLEWGEQPELRFATADGHPRLFVSRHGHDWWQLRYQIAHELFHWACSPPHTSHWSHEALAVETAVRAMEELAQEAYVERLAVSLTEEAGLLTVSAMLRTRFDLGWYPPGLYGRAWVTARELIAAAGWARVKPLARSFGDDSRPDVAAWVASLPAGRAAVEAVLGPPAADWV